MLTNSIGQFLKETRKAKKMTQSEVAGHLNVSPQAVSKWECCESLPDVALLPEVARLYDISIEDILNPGKKDQDEDYYKVIEEINSIIDQQLYSKLLEEFKKTKDAKELNVPLDFFKFLNNQQKDQLFELLFDMKNYGIIIDDILQYTNGVQRTKIIKQVLLDKDYENLEMLIPYTSKNLRKEILEHLLEDQQFEFLEDMLPFLNRDQKDMIIDYILEKGLSFEILENYMVFFDTRQRKKIQEWYQ